MIEQAIQRLVETPQISRPCDEIKPGYRRYGVGSHIIYFKVTAAYVDIIRILHQRRDAARHLA